MNHLKVLVILICLAGCASPTSDGPAMKTTMVRDCPEPSHEITAAQEIGPVGTPCKVSFKTLD